jgi:hypothetical protein
MACEAHGSNAQFSPVFDALSAIAAAPKLTQSDSLDGAASEVCIIIGHLITTHVHDDEIDAAARRLPEHARLCCSRPTNA